MIKALKTTAVIQPIQNKKSDSGIILQSDKHHEVTNKNKVIDCGDESLIGETVIVHRFKGEQVDHGGEVYRIVKIEDIEGIVG